MASAGIEAYGIGMTDKSYKTQSDNSSVCTVMLAVAMDTRHAPTAAKGVLSAREVEITMLASHAKTGLEMALLLSIAGRTVAFHINNIVEKLGAANKTHATALALGQGLIA